MINYDGKAIVKRYCMPIADRVSFDADLSRNRIDEVDCTVVFVHAFWSVPSVQSLVRLADALAAVDPPGDIPLLVCDIDCVSHLSGPPFNLDTTRGIGEVLWIYNGAIHARHDASHRCDFHETTLRLIAKCRLC